MTNAREEARKAVGPVLEDYNAHRVTSWEVADSVSDVWEPIVRALVSEEACYYDHNNYCQTHYYQRPCAHEVAKEALGE